MRGHWSQVGGSSLLRTNSEEHGVSAPQDHRQQGETYVTADKQKTNQLCFCEKNDYKIMLTTSFLRIISF